MRRDVLRIIDANLNRSREGLRVCEDIARFGLNSAAITKELKIVRHRISSVVKRLPMLTRDGVLSRDSRADVGKCSKMKSEMARADLADIWLANAERAKESLRVLEEIFKLSDASGAEEFSLLRFRMYEIEKRAIGKIESLRNAKER